MNALHIINMVGTRHATDYGTQLCTTFLRDLKTLCPDVLVVSGLAYGIDINAHRSALDNDLPTVGVLAHGLDRIYPSLHRKTAVEMLDKGGLLTEFPVGTTPDKHNFISRNRIVAGMCDATIVVESAAKGGSLITAELAESYHRDCFAFPGRVTDEYSKGCNQLIRDSKASLLLSAEDLVEAMGWTLDSHPAKVENVQRSLYQPQDIVHSNEFVANRFAVANPNLRPIFDAIDVAQRSGNVGNLTAEDIAAVAGSGKSTRTVPAKAPAASATTTTNDPAMVAMLIECTRVLRKLKNRLDAPLVAETYVTGKRGINQAQKEYQKLNNNKSRNKQ